jgi:hypothetical protein
MSPKTEAKGDADRTHHLARRTKPALQAIVGKKCLLYRMKSITLCHTFDRKDVGSIVTDRKREAGIDSSSLDDDRAGAAPDRSPFRSGQIQVPAKQIQERDSRILELDRSLHAVYSQSR